MIRSDLYDNDARSSALQSTTPVNTSTHSSFHACVVICIHFKSPKSYYHQWFQPNTGRSLISMCAILYFSDIQTCTSWIWNTQNLWVPFGIYAQGKDSSALRFQSQQFVKCLIKNYCVPSISQILPQKWCHCILYTKQHQLCLFSAW